MHHIKAHLHKGESVLRTEEADSVITLCLPVLSYGVECLLLFPASADGDADMVSLNFNWKAKRPPSFPVNQYIFDMMVLIKSCENGR